MFNLSGSEIIVILLLALVVLGPDKLPEAMRKAGKTFAELKKLSTGFQDEVRKGFEEPTTELRKTANTIRDAATIPGVTKKSLKNQPATYPDKPHYNPAVDPAPSLPEGSSVAVPVAETDAAAQAAHVAEVASAVESDPAGELDPAVEVNGHGHGPAGDAAEPADVVSPEEASADEATGDEEAAVGPDLGV